MKGGNLEMFILSSLCKRGGGYQFFVLEFFVLEFFVLDEGQVLWGGGGGIWQYIF